MSCNWLLKWVSPLEKPHQCPFCLFKETNQYLLRNGILCITKMSTKKKHFFWGSLKVLAYSHIYSVCHEKTDLKVFVVVIPKEGWARVATPVLEIIISNSYFCINIIISCTVLCTCSVLFPIPASLKGLAICHIWHVSSLHFVRALPIG